MEANSRWNWKRLELSGVLVLLALGVVGCATGGAPRPVPGAPTSPTSPESPEALNAVYNAAIEKSAVYRAAHQQTLMPVTGPTAAGSVISCDCTGGAGGGYCDPKCKLAAGPYQAQGDIWISRSDQFLAFCQSLSKELTAPQVVLKIEQYLGLPPRVNPGGACTWSMLQVQVDNLQVPAQFFRPCTNPDPTTPGPCTADFTNPSPLATADFRAWLAGQAFSSWKIPQGYPWTHLGYTYNWDPQAASIVGASEYVIAKGAPVVVLGVVPAVPLCTGGRLSCP